MKKIARITTSFGHYDIVDQVYNDRPARILYAGRSTPQSGLARDDDPELLFDYIQRLFEMALSTKPKSVLVIGGGAFVLPSALLARTNVERVDVVEVDPELPTIARQYFELPDDPRLRILTMDVRDFLQQSHDAKYDMIVVDAFSEYDIPEDLLSAVGPNAYVGMLTKSGFVSMNYIGYTHGFRARATKKLVMYFRDNFRHVAGFMADPDDDPKDETNLLIVASQQRLPDFIYLQTNETALPS